jgi:hypothetical protein
MITKKNGELKNKNSKRDIKRKKEMFTIQDIQIDSVGHVENTGT